MPPLTRRWSVRRVPLLVAAAACLVAACGSTGSTGSGQAVANHVHGAIEGTTGSDLLLATHYGLRLSVDGGTTWKSAPGLGDSMVAGIVRLGQSDAAAMQPMTDMPAGMHMTGPTGGVLYSTDDSHWTAAAGIDPTARVTALVAAPDGSTAWAAVLGQGIFRSGDGGRTWSEALPSPDPVLGLAVVGPDLLYVTDAGVWSTTTAAPARPAKAALSGTIGDITAWSACPTCVAVSLGGGGVATSADGGTTWKSQPFATSFTTLASVAGGVLLGMQPSPAQHDHGIWRSTDGGVSWTRVLDQPLVDRVYPGGAGGAILAFQWGITVWKSTDGGATWARSGTA